MDEERELEVSGVERAAVAVDARDVVSSVGASREGDGAVAPERTAVAVLGESRAEDDAEQLASIRREALTLGDRWRVR